MSKDGSGRKGSAPRVPPTICKSLLILGLPLNGVTVQIVVEAWKKQIVGVHPDKGGDTETAIILNTAKDSVVHWLESGGGWNRGPNQSSPVPRRPYPSAGDNVVVLPIPKFPNDDV
jgi:hypothetical protein